VTKQQQIDCEQALEQILEYVDHELGENERTALEHHLHTCKSCFSRMDFERRLKEKVAALREEKVSSAISERIKGLLDSF
jgi:anti-sigma factor (TIGR02949 family)